MQVGDTITLEHKPFRVEWRVVRVTENGAELEFTGKTPEFVGFGRVETAPGGDVLTSDPAHAWLGKAHWPRS